MSTGDTCICGTKLSYAAGIGPYCPNKSCKIVDGPFDGSPSPHIAPPAEKGESAERLGEKYETSGNLVTDILEYHGFLLDRSEEYCALVNRGCSFGTVLERAAQEIETLRDELQRLRTPPQTRQSGGTELTEEQHEALEWAAAMCMERASTLALQLDSSEEVDEWRARARTLHALAQGGRT